MQFQRVLVPVGGVALVAAAYYGYGWPGVAMAASGGIMWMILHFTRLTQVMVRAGKRPIGYVDSAVMLNAKLKPASSLLHVIAQTQALGELLSPKDQQPEIFRWTDGGESHVTCQFNNGKLASWALVRPDPDVTELAETAMPGAAQKVEPSATQSATQSASP